MADLQYILTSTSGPAFADITLTSLKARLQSKEHRMCLNSKCLQKSNTESVVLEDGSTESVTRTLMSTRVNNIFKPNLATRFLGRKSNKYLTRAYKRRIVGRRYPISCGRLSIRNTSPMISPLPTSPSSRTSHSSPTSPTTRLSHSASSPPPASSQSAEKSQDDESVPVNCCFNKNSKKNDERSNSESYKKKLRVHVSTVLQSPLSPQSSPTSQSSPPLSQCSSPSICTRLSQSSISPQPSTSLQSSLPSQVSASQTTGEPASRTISQADASTLTDTSTPQKKRGRRPKVQPLKINSFLETADAYFLPDYRIESNELCSSSQVDVPLWKLKPFTNFFQLEGTENLNDTVFNKRHKDCETRERRRKRWDNQMLQNSKKEKREILKLGKSKKERNKEDPMSFLPDPEQLKFIDVSEKLPVIAFGHLIPHFQPCEFALTWGCDEKTKRGGRLSTAGSRVT